MKEIEDTFYKIVQLLFCNDLPPLAKFSNNGWSAAADKKTNVWYNTLYAFKVIPSQCSKLTTETPEQGMKYVQS